MGNYKLATNYRDELQKSKPITPADKDEIMDVSPDRHLENKVNEERAQERESNLLDDKRPVE